MIEGIRAKGLDNSNYIRLNFKDKVNIIKKIFNTKYIDKTYTIKQLIDDKE